MDDYASHIASRDNSNTTSPFKALKTFQPKFDVKENPDNYELHGELPGIEQENVQIEFTDPQTLTIKGRTEHRREEGTRPSTGWIGGEEGGVEQQQAKKITAEGEGEDVANYHQPSVEDEGPSSSTTNEQSVEKSTNSGEVAHSSNKTNNNKATTTTSRYWVSERSTGEFARTFAFPVRVDHDNVKASLKNGILRIEIPKLVAPVSRRIQIE